MIPNANSPGYLLSTLFRRKERDLKTYGNLCAFKVRLYTQHSAAKDPRELFTIRPVGDVEKFNTSALQETSTAPRSKNKKERKRKTTHERE